MPSPNRHAGSGAAVLAVPLLLVNSAGIFGQSAWSYDHVFSTLLGVVAGWVCSVLLALAIESIGVYLAWEAHLALLAGDASGGLRTGSYAVGLLAGGLNYAHFAPSLDVPTTAAVTFGLLSAISPWLWAIRSRRMYAAELRAQGLIESRAVKFSRLRWLLYFRPTFQATRYAVWHSITDPTRAVRESGITPKAALPVGGTQPPAPVAIEYGEPYGADPDEWADAPRVALLEVPVSPVTSTPPAALRARTPRPPAITSQVDDTQLATQLAQKVERGEVAIGPDGLVSLDVVKATLGIGQARAYRVREMAGLRGYMPTSGAPRAAQR